MSRDKAGHGGGRKFRENKFGQRHRVCVGDKGREIVAGINEDSRVIQQFRGYAKELDAKHDRHEEIVKMGRDITIDSKRIIFLLHTIDKESKKSEILSEAERLINHQAEVCVAKIARKLNGHDIHQYVRAYTGALQEYTEAVTYYQYLKNNTLNNWKNLERSLTYTFPENSSRSVCEENKKITETESSDVKLEKAVERAEKNLLDIKDVATSSTEKMNVLTLISERQYILGIADLTGELMRKCINNLACGDIDDCFQTCKFVRSIYVGFLGCSGNLGKEMNRKLYTLRQSLMKMENVCYMIRVRGSEIPRHMLADVAIGSPNKYPVEEDDEGYQQF